STSQMRSAPRCAVAIASVAKERARSRSPCQATTSARSESAASSLRPSPRTLSSRADTTVPGGGVEHWVDPTAFFSRGTSGQWRDLLNNADLTRYAARVRAVASDDLAEWSHRESID